MIHKNSLKLIRRSMSVRLVYFRVEAPLNISLGHFFSLKERIDCAAKRVESNRIIPQDT